MDHPPLYHQPRLSSTQEPRHSSGLAARSPLARNRHHTSTASSSSPSTAMYPARVKEVPVPNLARSSTAPHPHWRPFHEDDLSRSDSRRSGSRREQSPRSHPFRSAPGSSMTSLSESDADSESTTSSMDDFAQQRDPAVRTRDPAADRYKTSRKKKNRRPRPYNDVIFEEEDDHTIPRAVPPPTRHRVPSPESPRASENIRSSYRDPVEAQPVQAGSPQSRRHFRRHRDYGETVDPRPSRHSYATANSETDSPIPRYTSFHGPPVHCGQSIRPDNVHHDQDGFKYAICSSCTARICYTCGTKWKRCDCPAMPRRSEHDHAATQRSAAQVSAKPQSHHKKRPDAARETNERYYANGILSSPESSYRERDTDSALDSPGSPRRRRSHATATYERDRRAPSYARDRESDVSTRPSAHDREEHDGSRLRRMPSSSDDMGSEVHRVQGRIEAPQTPPSPRHSTALTRSRIGPMVSAVSPRTESSRFPEPDEDDYEISPSYRRHDDRVRGPPAPPAVPAAPSADYREPLVAAPDPAPPLASTYNPPATYLRDYPQPHGHAEPPMYSHSYPMPSSQALMQPQHVVVPAGHPQSPTYWLAHEGPRPRMREMPSPSPGHYLGVVSPLASPVPPPVPSPPCAVSPAPTSETRRRAESPGAPIRPSPAVPSPPPPPAPEPERHSRSGDYVANVSKSRTRKLSQERRMADRFNPDLRHSYSTPTTMPAHYHPMSPHLGHHPSGIHMTSPFSPAHHHGHHHHPHHHHHHHHHPMAAPAHHSMPISHPTHQQHPQTSPCPQPPQMYSYGSPAIPMSIPLQGRPSMPVMTMPSMPMGPMAQPTVQIIPGPPFASMPRRHTMDDELYGSTHSRSPRSSDLGPNASSGRRKGHRHGRSGDKHGASGGDSHSPSSSSRRRQGQKSESSTATTSRRSHPKDPEDDEDRQSKSNLAGLSGSGRGTNRILEWSQHVPDHPAEASAESLSDSSGLK